MEQTLRCKSQKTTLLLCLYGGLSCVSSSALPSTHSQAVSAQLHALPWAKMANNRARRLEAASSAHCARPARTTGAHNRDID